MAKHAHIIYGELDHRLNGYYNEEKAGHPRVMGVHQA